MESYVITIAREKGSGGSDVARLLSQKLAIPYYDRELLRKASDVSGINEELFGRADEQIGFKEMMRAAKKVYKGEVLPADSDDYVSTKNLFNFQAKVIKELAQTESCIIIGRCGDYLLSGQAHVLRVFVHASQEFRKGRIQSYSLSMSEREVVKLMNDCDKRRSEYYKYYTGQDWKDAGHVDISLDSSRLGIEGCAEKIIQCIPVFLGFDPDANG